MLLYRLGYKENALSAAASPDDEDLAAKLSH